MLVIIACTLTLDFSVRRYWERSLRAEIERSMRQKSEMFAERVQTDKTQTITELTRQASHAAEARATVIDSKGVVLADSEANPAQMENHATPSRPEVLAALRGEMGMSSRWSHTVGIDFLYVAVPIPGGAVRL